MSNPPTVDDFLAPTTDSVATPIEADIQPRVGRATGFDPVHLKDQNDPNSALNGAPAVHTRIPQNDPMNIETMGEEPVVIDGAQPHANVDTEVVGDALNVSFGTPGVYLYNQKTGACFNFEPAMATHPDAVVIGGRAVISLNRNNVSPLISNPVVNDAIEAYADSNGVIRPVQEALERMRASFFVAPDSAPGQGGTVAGSSDAFAGFSVNL